MAYQDGVIFQRTESGNSEIRNSKAVLRHNERLVFVLIDGVNTYVELRAKLRGLVRDKFDRALDGLKEKGLIMEVLFPLIDRKKDAIDPEILVDFLKVNSCLSPDANVDKADRVYSGMISGNGNAGLSVNTLTGATSQMGRTMFSPDDQLGDEVDFYLPVDVSLDDVGVSSRAKTKLVNVHPKPERRKRKRSKRPVIVQIGWHIYVYYGLLAVGVLLVLFSVFIRSFK